MSMPNRNAGPLRVVTTLVAVVLLGGCNALARINDIGSAPQMTKIENPVVQQGYQPVTLPMPRARPLQHKPNSLWRPGARAFFKDQRAAQIGDILTVNITISDEASIENETSRSRSTAEDSDLTNFLGYENRLGKILPNGVSGSSLVSLGTESKSDGKGSVDRSETVNLTIAAIVTQLLPNGNLVIMGSQEVRVNYEKRVLNVSGVVRPQDIDSSNTITHSQIAEARIAYGGVGQLSDMQQPRYGQQLFDVTFPF